MYLWSWGEVTFTVKGVHVTPNQQVDQLLVTLQCKGKQNIADQRVLSDKVTLDSKKCKYLRMFFLELVRHNQAAWHPVRGPEPSQPVLQRASQNAAAET